MDYFVIENFCIKNFEVMKNFGDQKWNFSNLGEVTWGARDPPPFLLLLQANFFLPLFRDFFLLFLASFCSFLRATTIPAELTSFFLSFTIRPQQQQQKQLQGPADQKQNRDRWGELLGDRFPATFRPFQAAIVEARSLFDSNP